MVVRDSLFPVGRFVSPRTIAALASLVLASVSVGDAVAAQGSWQPPIDISSSATAASNPQVEVAPDGTAVIAWRQTIGSTTAIQAAIRQPGQPFSPTVTLSPPGESVDEPELGVTPDGTFAVAWTATSGPNSAVKVAIRSTGTSFAAPVTISALDSVARLPVVAGSPDGSLTVAWQIVLGPTSFAMRVATRPRNGQFGAGVPIGFSGPPAIIVVAPDNTATLLWSASGVRVVTRPPGGEFGPVETIPGDIALGGPVDADVASDGTVTATWRSFLNPPPSTVFWSSRPPGGTFSAAAKLADDPSNGPGPAVGVLPDGTATVVWGVFTNGAQPPTNTILQTASRAPGSPTFGPASDLSTPGLSAFSVRLATSDNGTTTVIWGLRRPEGVIPQARTREPNGQFGPPVDLDTRGGGLTNIALAPDGSGVAVWNGGAPGSFTVRTAVTANSPAIRNNPSIVGRAVVGRRVTCDGAQFVGAESTQIVWKRGTSPVGTGTTYRVRRADVRRRLTCEVTATNPYGRIVAGSKSVRIPVPPAVLRRPTVVGVARVGRFVRCSGARFAHTRSTEFRWLRNGRAIPSATRARYRPLARDRGTAVKCQAIGNGPGGTVVTTSRPRTVL